MVGRYAVYSSEKSALNMSAVVVLSKEKQRTLHMSAETLTMYTEEDYDVVYWKVSY